VLLALNIHKVNSFYLCSQATKANIQRNGSTAPANKIKNGLDVKNTANVKLAY
jgi:hypothetical protein